MEVTWFPEKVTNQTPQESGDSEENGGNDWGFQVFSRDSKLTQLNKYWLPENDFISGRDTHYLPQDINWNDTFFWNPTSRPVTPPLSDK